MQQLKSLSFIIIIGLFITGLFIIQKGLKKRDGKARFIIGVLQTASHPALDAARDGFIKTLQEKLGPEVEFIIQNAEGSISNAQIIASRFSLNDDIKALYAIATPAAQAIYSTQKQKPIFIAAVTDPYALGIMRNGNVTGSTDMIDVEAQVSMVKKILPEAKTAAILYTNGESNSTLLAKKMSQELLKYEINPLEIGVSNESEIIPALENAMRNADFIIAPTDNTVASAITVIADFAAKAKKPFIASDNLLVKHTGILAARGVDYEQNGIQAALAAYAVLVEGKKPDQVPLATASTDKMFVNKKTLLMLGLKIPHELEPNVVLLEKNSLK
jgi:putative ABC transport system substrate-binding protein